MNDLNEHERAVATTLKGKLIPDPVDLPILRWPDGFEAQISIYRSDDVFEVGFFPLLGNDRKGHSDDLENRRYADFLRAVQELARAANAGIYIECQFRSKVGHILDHLGFRISQETLDDNEFWGEDFDDANYEWRPE